MSVATPVRRRQQIVVAATLACAASMLCPGLWAFLDPPSFAGYVDFAAYNEHLIHDAGAFQVSIGSALLLGLLVQESRRLRARPSWSRRRPGAPARPRTSRAS